jgi:diphosphomevalonate decarboxylase
MSHSIISWRSPSNIAIVKYWGKHGVQLPRNPNISFTLSEAFTETHLTYKLKEKPSADISLEFLFEGQPNEPFRAKQVKFLTSLLPIFPFLSQFDLKIDSHNSFPHSAGIASSASSMSALALCLTELEFKWKNTEGGNFDPQNPDFLKKASLIARLGSGSACRSVYPTMAAWGKCKDIKGASDEFAVPFVPHSVFETYHDAILIVSKGEKSVSSRMGHGLMDNNAFAKPRYAQAKARMHTLTAALKAGDVDTFGLICEDEAMTLHALMMTNSPWFTLLKPNTLKMIEILRGWREDTKLPAYFSLDAGPNLHLLFPDSIEKEVKALIVSDLQPLCEDQKVIYDRVGQGSVRL